MKPYIYPACTFAILFFTGFYHAITIDVQSYFVDECEELNHASVDIIESIFMPDSMPPLFTLVLRGWLATFGDRVSARWLSVIFSFGTILATSFFAKSLISTRVAILATILVAASPWQLFYAQLIRGYSMMTFIAALCIGFGLLARKTNDRKYWWLYGLTSILGMYSHYYFITIPLSFLVLVASDSDMYRSRRFVITSVLSGIAAVPLIMFVFSDFSFQRAIQAPRPMSVPAVVYSYLSYFTGYALGPSQRQLRSNYPWINNTKLVTEVVVVGFVAMVTLGAACQSAWRYGELKPFVVLLTVPLGFIGILGAATGITYNVRFIAWMVMPISILLGFLAIPRKKSWQTSALLTLQVSSILLVFILSNHNRIYNDLYKTEDIRKAMQSIQSQSKNANIFIVSGYLGVVADRYKVEGETIQPLPPINYPRPVIDDAKTLNECLTTISNATPGEFWLIYSREFHGDPNGLFIASLTERSGSIVSFDLVSQFAGVLVYRGTIGTNR